MFECAAAGDWACRCCLIILLCSHMYDPGVFTLLQAPVGRKWQQLPQVPAQALLPLQQNSIPLPVAIKREVGCGCVVC